MSKSICRLSLGLAILALSAGAANAQTQELISNPRGMVANFDPVNLGPVLTELGIVWQERKTVDGMTFIAASIGASLNFNIVPAACLGPNSTNCVGAYFLTMFSGGANPQSVSAFNQKYWFTSAGIQSDGSGAYLGRYDIADYGIPRGNIASSIGSYFALAQRFRDEIAAKTVSADGYVDDMSASMLNVRSAEAIGIDAAVEGDGSMIAIHQASLEATPELVRKLISSDNAPRNKITNVTE
ncbi:MAG: YbjN domain-containing protein [Pseudomonadota bacterium]